MRRVIDLPLMARSTTKATKEVMGFSRSFGC